MARKRRATETELRHRHRVHVPSDLVESVLARLPVKSILRFRSVSKSWNQIISHPHFSNLHSQAYLGVASSSYPTRFLIRRRPTFTNAYRSFCLLNFSGEEFQLDAGLGAPFGAADNDIVCYCNGLLLLNDNDNWVVLWNPYTGMYLRICGMCGRECQHEGLHNKVASILKSATVGICHDPKTDDYKVVTIDRRPSCFSVFSCKHKVWTKTNEKLENLGGVIRTRGGVYVDGACYWICYYPPGPGCDRRAGLLCFNGIDDKCEMLQLPASVEMGLRTTIFDDMVLLNLKGCLGLIYQEEYHQYQRIYIASMEKNGHGSSWRHQTTIDFDIFGAIFLTIIPPCPISDRLVVIFLNQYEFIVYDVYEESMVQGVRKFPQRWEGMLVPYHQRLFFQMF